MKTLTKVVVGSRLHGLDNEKSDWDFRGIHMHQLKEVLSPFRTLKDTQWMEGVIDDTSYELRDFVKSATKGNATTLEVFFSNRVIETSPLAEELRENWHKFIDTDLFVAASRGYAANQYNKMQLFDPDKRTPKFAVAYCRVMWQCAEFLRTGVFPCQISDPNLKEFLLEIKNNFRPYHIAELGQRFTDLQKEVTDAYKYVQENNKILKPDIEWIEEFLLRAYTNND
jgi:predicted nucleotidyltransferase